MKLSAFCALSTAIIMLVPACAQPEGDAPVNTAKPVSDVSAAPADQLDPDLTPLQPRKYSHRAFAQPHIRHRRTSPR